VVTNGSQLDRHRDTLATRSAYVRVSLDGPTPASHRRVHRSDDFAAVTAGVAALVEARGDRRDPILGLSFALDHTSVSLAPQAIDLAEQLRVDYALLRPPFFEEVGRTPTMSIRQARAVRRRLHRLAAAHSGAVEVMVGGWVGDAEQALGTTPPGPLAAGRRDTLADDGVPIEHRTGRCLASPLLAVVTADGTLYGCCNLRALPAWAMGRLDYGAGIGFASLWQGPRRQAILARMHRTDCIAHCTHPLTRYNEIVELLREPTAHHREFL
jgi:hypothetical protein